MATVPGAPTIGAATAGNTTASIAFTAPTSSGGATITGYTVTCTAAGSLVMTGTASPITVTGLTNGTTYSCSVKASNTVGVGASSGTVSVTPSASSTSTASVLCPYSGTYAGSYGGTLGNATATWSWSCSGTSRSLTGNGLPNHPVGSFPGPGNPNPISAQSISATMTLTPARGTVNTLIGGGTGYNDYALNSVKFDPGTAGTCPSSATATSQCTLLGNTGVWSIEALGQTTFDFGVDSNKAHVQPNGQYHYHGVPEGLLANAGATDTSRKMVLVGWAADGYPMYARYCYSSAMDASSALKVCTGSYALVSTPASGRPSASLIPLGAFQQDWTYSAGSGDLDDCNGRTGVTPEFPGGIYYYMATDTYPYFSRCVKGVVN